MAEVTNNLVIKVVLVVVTAVLMVVFGIQLVTFITTGEIKDVFNDLNILARLLMIIAGLVLSALAFWGAFVEWPTLCYISLGGAIGITAFNVYFLCVCAFGNTHCDTMAWVWCSLSVVCGVLFSFAIYSFIQSISK